MDSVSKKILIVGASADLATSLNEILYKSSAALGFHYNKNKKALSKFKESKRIGKFKKNLNCSKACCELVDEFVSWSGGIDGLVQLSGDIAKPIHWESLTEEQWHYDLAMNLVMPFFLVQRAVHHMKKNGGRIVLMSTASVVHGGGANSLAYGVAKSGIECLVKGLARDCAKYNILVNAVAPGFIPTKFHTDKMKRDRKQLEGRIQLIPLQRPGTTTEVAGAIIFFLSKRASYITGQVLTVSGGDWL